MSWMPAARMPRLPRRRAALAAALTTAVTLAAAPAVLAAPAGRSGNDDLPGTARADVLLGGRGQDVLRGGPGGDRLNGGADADHILAGPGDDRVIAADGSPDIVDCGPGTDTARVDALDEVEDGCESVDLRGPAPGLLWSNLGPEPWRRGVARASIDGTRVQPDFIVAPERPRRFGPARDVLTAVASGGRYLFASDWSTGAIVRTDDDGDDQVDDLVQAGLPLTVTSTAATGTDVFWIDVLRGTIGRARADGAKRDPYFIRRLKSEPIDLATDGTWLYWTTSRGTIARAGLDGSKVDESFVRLPGQRPLGLDATAEFLFWTADGRTIGRARTDGSDVRPFLLETFPGAAGVAADAGHVYWTNVITETVGRAGLDGSDPDSRFIRRGTAAPWMAAVERVPAGTIAPRTRDFGDQPVGGTAGPLSFQVRSLGNAPLSLGATRVSGLGADQFAVTADDCSGAVLDPGASCTISVSFTPTTPGGKAARVLIGTDDPSRPVLRGRLRGAGTVPDAAIDPSSADFGPRAVGSGPSAPLTFTVASTGSAPLTIGTAGLNGDAAGDFALADDDCSGETLAPGTECTIAVTFDPSAHGARDAGLQVPTSAPDAPVLTAALSGSGLTAGATLTPAVLAFPERQEGTGPGDPLRATLTSSGDAPLDVTSVGLTGADAGEFRIVSDECSGTALPPGESCPVDVAFAPASEGDKAATLAVTADDPGLEDPAATASLTGSATATPLPPAPPPQPTPFPVPLPSGQTAGCGVTAITAVDAEGATSASVNGVRQPVVTRPYDGRMTVTGTTTCASGQVVTLWGPRVERRSASTVAARRGALEVIANAAVAGDGTFRLPVDTRAPGQYTVTLPGTPPLAGSPLWLRLDPVLSAHRRGTRVTAYAGPPAATTGATAVLERRSGGAWRRVSTATVSRRARAVLRAPASGALRVRVVPRPSADSLQPDLMTAGTAAVR